MNNVLQSGQVTPQHLAAFVTDGVIGDAGVTFNNTLSFYRSDVLGINFNATNQDTPIPINLPAGRAGVAAAWSAQLRRRPEALAAMAV